MNHQGRVRAHAPHCEWPGVRLEGGRPRYAVVPLGPPSFAPRAFSPNGLVVGASASDGVGMRAAILSGGVVRLVGSLGGSFSVATGVNAVGDVVGGGLTTDDVLHHGFLYRAGTLVDLNLLVADRSWTVLEAHAIDDAGCILASASRDGCDRAVLLMPEKKL